MTIQLNELFGITAVLEAARASGLLVALIEGGGTAAALAHKLELDPRALGRELDALAAFDLAVADPAGGWRASPTFAKWVEESPGGRWGLDLWGHSLSFLRTGRPFMDMDGTAAARAQRYRSVVPRLGQLFAAAADDLATRLPLQPRRVLDVGCGSGVWSLAIAAKHPAAHVVGLDLPGVVDAFVERAAAHGLSGRVETLAGDVHTVELPRDAYDLVVIANVLRIETPDRARAIVARVAPAVAAGGAILVVDALGGQDVAARQALALYAFHLAMRTAQGEVHPAARIAGWLAEHGFAPARALALTGTDGSHGALWAERAT